MELSNKIAVVGRSFKSSTFYIVNMTTNFYASYRDSFTIVLQ